jgi:hypothetical protein
MGENKMNPIQMARLLNLKAIWKYRSYIIPLLDFIFDLIKIIWNNIINPKPIENKGDKEK